MKKIATMMILLAVTLPALLAQEPEIVTEEPEIVAEEPKMVAEEPSMEVRELNTVTPVEKQKRNPSEVQTLFSPNSGSGGYGAFTIGYTQINSKDAILMGGRGAWVIGHGFGLGIGGYGFVNDPVYNSINQLNYSLAGGYGGLLMEPILFGWFPVHLSFPIMIGAGGVANTIYPADWSDPYNYYDGYVEDATAFFVADIGMEVEFNLVRFFRLAVFGSYRYTSDIIMNNTPANALRGWSAGMTFKFGSF